mmetsp:Transcript_23230/g.59233  ORF Transcript_23230/g.59233 Transcript_23230/m.59233 type:complete len:301 (+) Transcript_23230:52-954(+)
MQGAEKHYLPTCTSARFPTETQITARCPRAHSSLTRGSGMWHVDRTVCRNYLVWSFVWPLSSAHSTAHHENRPGSSVRCSNGSSEDASTLPAGALPASGRTQLAMPRSWERDQSRWRILQCVSSRRTAPPSTAPAIAADSVGSKPSVRSRPIASLANASPPLMRLARGRHQTTWVLLVACRKHTARRPCSNAAATKPWREATPASAACAAAYPPASDSSSCPDTEGAAVCAAEFTATVPRIRESRWPSSRSCKAAWKAFRAAFLRALKAVSEAWSASTWEASVPYADASARAVASSAEGG